MKMDKKYFGFALAIVLVAVIGFFAGSATAQGTNRQSHPANEIDPGMFASGLYNFPSGIVLSDGGITLTNPSDISKITSRHRLDIGARDLMLYANGTNVWVRLNPMGENSNAKFIVAVGASIPNPPLPYEEVLTVGTSGNLWAKGDIYTGGNRIEEANKIKKAYLNRCYSAGVNDHLYYATQNEDKGCEGNGAYVYERSYKIMTWE